MSIEISKSLQSCARTGTHFLRTLKQWGFYQSFKMQIRTERRDLASLPLHLLRDIGVDPMDALQESRRSLSDVPLSRLQRPHTNNTNLFLREE